MERLGRSGPFMVNITKESALEKIKTLLERYEKTYIKAVGARVSDYSEQDTVTKFIKPLIEALGWNILSMEEMREEVHFNEKRIDCVLYMQGKPYIVFEFKSLGFGDLRNKSDVIKELVNNAKALKAKYAVFTRFLQTIVYNPQTGDEICYFAPYNLIEKFDILWKYLSKHSHT
jgi:predicted type IV restriction endonuclease